MKEVTGKPIKFLGMGETLDALEEFRPEGLASRILGFGDIVGLVQDFEKVVDEKKAEEDAKKILSGDFTMVTFLEQIRTLKKMGSVKDIFEKMPFFGDSMPADLDDKSIDRVEAIILSMTKQERAKPEILKASRKRRIAAGAGVEVADVNKLIKMHRQMADMMKKASKKGRGGLAGMLGGGMPGGMPPGAGGMNPADLGQATQDLLGGKAPGGGNQLPGLGSGQAPQGLPGLGGGAPQLGPDGLPIGFPKK